MGDSVIEIAEIGTKKPLLGGHNDPNHNNSNDRKKTEMEIIKRNVLHNTCCKLLKAVLNNEKNEIIEIIENYKDDKNDLRLYRFKNEGNKKERDETEKENSIWVIACIKPEVSAETLVTLFESMKYGDAKFIDDQWYGWEPIHYIASTANHQKLKSLLEVFKAEINSLTYLSENALHVLLEYDKSANSFSVLMQKNGESRTTTIIGPEKDDTFLCAKILIEKGIYVNQSNCWNETPICLAIRHRYIKSIKKLLTVDTIDIDSYKESGKSIREYLKWNLYINVPKSYVQEDPVIIRFNFLKSGDEEGFLRYSPDTLSDHANSIYWDDSCTMLQFCLRKGFLCYLQDTEHKYKRPASFDINDNPMMSIFKEKGLARCIIHLLHNGADISKTTIKFKEKLLDFSSVRGYYPFVALLLQHKNSTVTIDDIFEVLKKINKEKQFELKNKEFYLNCVLHLLLNKLIFLIRHCNEKEEAKNKEDDDSNKKEHTFSSKKQKILNELLYTLNLECDESKLNNTEIIYQLLHLGANLTYRPKKNFDKMVVERIDHSLLNTHFDDCIDGTTFKYDSIIQDDDQVYNENRTLHYLVTDKIKQPLLAHPLVIQLLREKWSRIKKVFYADLLFYMLLLISIYLFVVTQHFGYSNNILNIFFFIFIGLHFFKEFIQLAFLYRCKYFKEPSNILESITIICCLCTIFKICIFFSVASILLSTFILFLLLGQLPFFTKYTIIFSSIKYFIQYMAFYSIQFVAFSICFYLVFPFQDSQPSVNGTSTSQENNNKTGPDWGDFSKNLFYTFIYFTGEFSERVLEPTNYPVFGRALMIVFIFCMTIILNSLLVGLIVADMDHIRTQGRLHKQVRLASFIQSTNTFIKRIHTFKYLEFIKSVIKYVDVFKKGEEKVLKNVNVNKFDDVNITYLKNIQKTDIFNRHVLRDVYREILQK